jgi:hypothetical protein
MSDIKAQKPQACYSKSKKNCTQCTVPYEYTPDSLQCKAICGTQRCPRQSSSVDQNLSYCLYHHMLFMNSIREYKSMCPVPSHTSMTYPTDITIAISAIETTMLAIDNRITQHEVHDNKQSLFVRIFMNILTEIEQFIRRYVPSNGDTPIHLSYTSISFDTNPPKNLIGRMRYIRSDILPRGLSKLITFGLCYQARRKHTYTFHSFPRNAREQLEKTKHVQIEEAMEKMYIRGVSELYGMVDKLDTLKMKISRNYPSF